MPRKRGAEEPSALYPNSMKRHRAANSIHHCEESNRFLRRFSACCGHQPTGVNALVWECFAELNVLLRQNSSKLSEVPLNGYVSLTRCGKSEAFYKLLSMERLSSQQLSLLCPPHVQVINVALERFFASFDEASLCRYTLKVQDWMKQWGQKWGFQASELSLWTINAYSSAVYNPIHIHGGELTATPSSLQNTLFCPVIPV